jgi:hypothetical protein
LLPIFTRISTVLADLGDLIDLAQCRLHIAFAGVMGHHHQRHRFAHWRPF